MRTFLVSARAELARITAQRMSTISLIALMFIPVVYGGLYLWGNKDPYSSLDRVPAALVVADRGAEFDGEQRDLGREAANRVLDSKDFDWHRTSESAARAGVQSGRYDFALIFPADFSADLASASGSDPAKAELRLVTDDTNSYLSTTIAKQAATQIGAAVAERVGRTATLQLLDGVADLRSGLEDAASGAGDLADGAASAHDGATSLAGGTAQLQSGAASLASGTTQLKSGAAQLDGGLATLQSSTAQLPAQTGRLAAGAQQVSTGIGTLHAGSEQTSAYVLAQLDAAGTDPVTRAKVAAALAQLSAGSAPDSELAGGARQVAAGAGALSSSSSALRDGIAAAKTGAGRLASGAASADRGAAQLASGAASAHDGATQLADGTAKLDDGATKLQQSLQQGVDDTPATTAAQRKATAAALAAPITVRQHGITEASDYGAGLAPFFISLAAWIGIYALFLLLRPLSRRALSATRRPVATALAGWAVPAGLGVIQMLALFAVVAGPLHLQIADPLGLIAFLVLVTATYAAIVLALNVWLGSVGQFLGLLLMVVQLVTAGGTFPWQTLPGPLAVLHQALPMAHAVDGVRQLMYGGSGPALGGAVGMLALWLGIGLVAAVLGAAKQSGYRTIRELRPSAIGA